jgi:SPP1 family predicted phage head-tail adaptor
LNIGELTDRISVLAIKRDENTYAWEQTYNIWAKVEQLSGNRFSKSGQVANSIKFTIRKNSSISLHNAFRWQGEHCLLTDIINISSMFQEVRAVLIEPQICTAERTGAPVLNELNRPIYNSIETLTFPGYLQEKYIGHTHEELMLIKDMKYVPGEPMATTEKKYVLDTPKIVDLIAGEIVTIDDITHTVIMPHTLDEYKNEYEIMAKGDV